MTPRERVDAAIRRQKQAFLHEPEAGVFGDCYRTCIAILLGVGRDTVPHFYSTVDGQQNSQAAAWLLERGYTIAGFAYELDPEGVLAFMGQQNPLTPYMLSGFSRTGCNHCVIALGDKIVWDPSLTNAGIVGRQDSGVTWVDIVSPIPGQAWSPATIEAWSEAA